MIFRLADSKSENYKDIEIPNKDLIEYLADYAYEELLKECDCEIGETKPTLCVCEEYENYYLSEVF